MENWLGYEIDWAGTYWLGAALSFGFIVNIWRNVITGVKEKNGKYKDENFTDTLIVFAIISTLLYPWFFALAFGVWVSNRVFRFLNKKTSKKVD